MLYHMKKQGLTIEKRLLEIAQVWVKVPYWIK